VEIAKSLGASVTQEKFRGFGPQKKFAVDRAKGNWVLCLDADEALSEEAQNTIIQLFRHGEPHLPAYQFSRISFHMGRWIRHGGWYPDWQLRLFDKRKGNWNDAAIHEKVEAPGPIGKIYSDIQHWVFDDLTDQIQTNNRYSSLGAQEQQKQGKRYSLFKLLTKPVSKFFETYVWKRGFLDGLPGFIIAVGAAYSVFLKYAKLWELERH
jgi:hypothetical protein